MVNILSKSKYIAGIQCLKYLWYLINDPEKIPPFDEATRFRFQQGHDAGNLAKALFPQGIEVGDGSDVEAELTRSRELARLTDGPDSDSDDSRRPLFEASFTYKNTFARADILQPSGIDAWNIIEVKSASSVKDINKHDIAFQKYCYQGAGLKIDKCYLMHLNRDFVKDGPIDPKKFFLLEDVTEEAEALAQDVETNVNLMLKTVNDSTCPHLPLSKDCYNPYECPLKDLCWNNLPEFNVFELYRGKNLAFDLYQNGITRILDIEDTSVFNPIQQIQIKTIKENRIFMDSKALKLFLDQLEYPLYFLDFETFSTAIPLFDGTGPYQNVPFQFSCHILKHLKGLPENLYFLAEDDQNDPRPELLDNLKKALGYGHDGIPVAGSILVYYKSFEIGILNALAEAFPQHAWWIEDAIGRITDLYEPFGKFYYYNCKQKGSASLKRVLPALTGISYGDMEIKNGEEASLKFLNTSFFKDGKEVNKIQLEKIRKDLIDYCGLDTEGMIFILRKLYKLAEDSCH
ncbi:MAG: DUF2779 domain-containing protein [Actinomycetia bacterium]|nr:DUF2779 domain-containing protein [Actinomycetes bacterium]